MYLIIDTSTKYAAAGLWHDGALVRTAAWRSRRHHTVELMPAIERLLNEESASPDSLQGIAVATGPGGFSALRAGLSAAKGLAFALALPVAGVNSLEASAYPYRNLGYPVCAMLPLGRDLLAWARFQQGPNGWRRSTPDRLGPIDALLQRRGRHTLFCGEGAAAYSERLADAMGSKAHLAEEATPLTRLLGVALLGAARLAAGDTEPLASLQAHYLRSPGITQPKPLRAIVLGSPRRKPGRKREPQQPS